MRDRIDFSRNEHDFPVAKSGNGYFAALGSQLTSDIQKYAPDVLELLQVIDEVRRGESPMQEYEGNSYIFRATSDGVTLESLGPSGKQTTYTFDEATSVVKQYFDFLAPTPEEKAQHVATWEREFGRPYPGRAELGLS
jgi:hypothetical protein